MISALQSAPVADLAIFAVLFGFFVFGVVQGAIRSLLGTIAVVFAFLVSANLREPVGAFLADNWRHYPPDYARMLTFLGIFLALSIAAFVVVQGFYRRVELSSEHPIMDDIAGGLLGLLQGVILLVIAVVIIGSYKWPVYRFDGEYDQLRWLHDVLFSQSSIGPAFRDGVVPFLFHLIGGLLPSDLLKAFP
jgi:uncharacterized membrane protein required for colicin V production